MANPSDKPPIVPPPQIKWPTPPRRKTSGAWGALRWRLFIVLMVPPLFAILLLIQNKKGGTPALQPESPAQAQPETKSPGEPRTELRAKKMAKIEAATRKAEIKGAAKEAEISPKTEGLSATPLAATDLSAETENSTDLLARAEQLIRTDHLSDAMGVLNKVIRNYPASHEAVIVKRFIALLRQKGATRYTDSVESCTMDDVSEIKKSWTQWRSSPGITQRRPGS